jgi:hypothetical protein
MFSIRICAKETEKAVEETESVTFSAESETVQFLKCNRASNVCVLRPGAFRCAALLTIHLVVASEHYCTSCPRGWAGQIAFSLSFALTACASLSMLPDEVSTQQSMSSFGC